MRSGIEQLYRVCWVDISGGTTGKKQQSRSAYVVLGQDELLRIFILETYGAHIKTTEFQEKLFQTEEKWQLRVMGFDASATQGVFVTQFEQVAKLTNRHLPTIHRESMAGNKLAHIENILQPISAQGRLFRLPEAQCRELRGEWDAFPTGTYLDILDALACGIDYLLPKKAQLSQKAEKNADLVRYLKNSGVSQEYIEKRLRELSL